MGGDKESRAERASERRWLIASLREYTRIAKRQATLLRRTEARIAKMKPYQPRLRAQSEAEQLRAQLASTRLQIAEIERQLQDLDQ